MSEPAVWKLFECEDFVYCCQHKNEQLRFAKILALFSFFLIQQNSNCSRLAYLICFCLFNWKNSSSNKLSVLRNYIRVRGRTKFAHEKNVAKSWSVKICPVAMGVKTCWMLAVVNLDDIFHLVQHIVFYLLFASRCTDNVVYYSYWSICWYEPSHAVQL